MKTNLVTLVFVLMAWAFVQSSMKNAHATEGAFYDNRGMDMPQTDRWRSHAAEGAACLGMKQYNRAIAYFTAALEAGAQGSAAAELYQMRGNAYLEEGDGQKAQADYRRALVFVPRESGDYLNRGWIYEKQGNWKAAASAYRKAVELAPESADALNCLAWSKATSPEASLREGRAEIGFGTKACEARRWKESDAIDTLAAAYAEAGNFAQAIKYEEQTIKLQPRDERREFEERQALYHQGKPYRQKAKLAAHQ